MHKLKKVSAVFLALVMTVISVVSSVGVAAFAETGTVAEWNATAAVSMPWSATTGTGKLSTVGVTKSEGGYSSSSVTSEGWAEGSYWLMSGIDATGYESLTFSAKQRSSGTGPSTFVLEYSLDGSTWTHVANGVVINSTSLKYTFSNVSLPSALNNTTFSLRIRCANNISGNGIKNGDNATIAAKGTSNINAVVISGTVSENVTPDPDPTPDPTPVCSAVTASPAAGEVESGTKVTLSTATTGAAIKYSTDGGTTYLDYTAPIEITEAVTITAYATLDGYENSTPASFAYTVKAAVVMGNEWTKVNLSEIQPGDTIAITMTKGDTTWALYNGNGTGTAPTAIVVTASGSTMNSEDVDSIAWNITQDANGIIIYKAGGTSAWLYSNASNNNGTRVGTNDNKYWVVDSASGYLMHVATSRYLGVYNSQDWRAYTNTTGNTAGQTLGFWRYGASSGPVTPTCSAVTASPAAGVVESGTTVTLSSATAGATIKYSTDGGATYQDYTAPIAITANTTITAYATLSGYNNSAASTFAYTLPSVVTVAEARAAASNTTGITVKGIVVRVDSKNVVIQDSTGGINLYFSTSQAGIINVGDEIVASGTKNTYSGLEQLKSATLIRTESTGNTLPVKTVTLAELASDYSGSNSLESTRVYIENVTIGEIKTNGNTTLTDVNGNTINIYKVPALTDIAQGDTVNLYAIVGDFNGYQLRVNEASDVTKVSSGEEADEYTVKFNSDGGSEVAEQVVANGAAATKPEDPTKEGATFLGWYLGDAEYDFSTPVTANIELTAKWEETSAPSIPDGDYVIWVPAHNMALSSVYSGGSYYNDGVSVTETDGVLSGYGETEIWTVKNNDDGTISISYGGQNLGLAASYASMSLGAVNDTWTVEDAGDGLFYIKNVGRGNYIEWYASKNYWSSYYKISSGSEGLFALKFTPAQAVEEPAGDRYAKLDNNISDSEQFIIYYNGKSEVMGTATNANANKFYGVSAIPEENKILVTDEMLVLTASVDENGYYTFTSPDGKYLTCGASGNSLTLEDTAYEYSLWVIKEVEGGVHINNVTANYKGTPQAIEYYSGFTTYGEKDTEIYCFNLYVLTDTQKDDYAIDKNVVADVFYIAGTVIPGASTVYGDVFEANDGKDTDTTLTISDGSVPKTGSASPISIGTKGLTTDKYVLITTNGGGFANMSLSFRIRCSSTGPKNLIVSYSTDGVNYIAAGDTNVKIDYTIYGSGGSTTPVSVDKNGTGGVFQLATDGKFHDVTVKLPNGAWNAETLYIKITAADNTSVGGNTVGTGGTTYINEIKLVGNPTVSDDRAGYVTVTPASGEIAGNTALTMTNKTGGTIYYSINGEAAKVYDSANKPVLTADMLPGAVRVWAAKEGLKDSIDIVYTYTQATCDPVSATPNGGSVYENSRVNLSCTTEGATVLYAVVSESDVSASDVTWTEYSEAIVLTKLPAVVLAKAVKEGCVESAVSEFKFTERTNENYNIYFGQLHSHTNFSDGAGSCEEAFQYASTADNIDFVAVTDHSNSFDNGDSATINNGSMSSEWVLGHELADKYTTEDFVGLYGYEMTWSNGLGHINTFNSDGFQHRNQSAYSTYSTALQNYYAALATAPNTMSQFNHPGTTFGDFSDFDHYSATTDQLITLIEVGNGEGAVGGSLYFPSYEYYIRALDKGWHLAPSNNQDNHKGLWGDANTCRTVVLADSLTRDNIYDAIRNYRVYATEDNDLSIYYTLDNYIMGTILPEGSVGEEATIKVIFGDPTDAAIGKVEVVVNGGLTIASETVSTNYKTVEFTVPGSYSYYFIRVTQPDGNIAVTAPVWVGDVEACGISDISTETAVPVSNQPVDVNLTLFNNEKDAMDITSIEFKVDGTVIHTVDLATADMTSVPAESTKTYSFNYVGKHIGDVEIEAVVKANVGGSEKQYNAVLQLSYVAPEMVTKVLIDGTHFNDYVTGYYGGNMNAFIDIAASMNIVAEVVTDEITPEKLEDAALLVISAPAKKSGTANAGDYTPQHFSAEFIAMVADYVKNGGSVIVCGLADYQDSSNGQTYAELNPLLEALGTGIRVFSDEGYDTENNGGQAYRLYLDKFNTTDPYMEGVVEGQVYSAYSVCTVDVTNAPNAVVLVRGHDTTYSVNTKDENGGYADSSTVVEKGDVVELAYEKTPYGGTIFVAGGIFMSDFEVKAEIDNNESLPYANYNIIKNILAENEVQLPTTDIAIASLGDKGQVFAIEGYVTAGTANEYNTFFDAIYLQDATGGITVFPFSAQGLELGTKMRIVGYIDEYQGDKEIQIMSYEILDSTNLNPYDPTVMTAADAMDYANNGGELIKVEGEVVKVKYTTDGAGIAEMTVKDATGEAEIFIDGYILSGTTGKNELGSIKVGDTVSAVGLLYMHPGNEGTNIPVLRVRNCDEVVLIKAAEEGELTVVDNENLAHEVEHKKGIKFSDEYGNIYTAKFVKLYIEKLSDNLKPDALDAVAALDKNFDKDSKDMACYDIYLKNNEGDKVSTVDDEITITLKYPAEVAANYNKYTYKLYHVKADGTAEQVKINLGKNGVTFDADEFSPYILTWTQKSGGAATGDTFNAVLWANIFLLSAVAVVAVVAVNRKKIYALIKK